MATLTDCIILCHRCRIDQLFPQYHESRKLFVSLVASALTDSVVVFCCCCCCCCCFLLCFCLFVVVVVFSFFVFFFGGGGGGLIG